MDKEFLLKSAQNLKQVSESTAEEYSQKRDKLVEGINNLMLDRDDINSLIGDNNSEMMKDNHANHARFIASILKNHNPEVLVDTILWVFRAYRSHGFKTNYWAAQLNAWITTLKKELSTKAFVEVAPLYEWMQINIPVFVNVTDEQLRDSDSRH